ncbi:MAG: DUF465 domain-containing protein [Alphaproteobacteria bacterium]|nr:MAG: DUF465 domain-containing protein [Alphaproteobacteria bacterium]
MSHVPHELAEEFPEYKDKIHTQKESNPHFQKLFDEYHAINREIHRLETRVETASDDYEHDLRKKRMVLKDELAAILSAA